MNATVEAPEGFLFANMLGPVVPGAPPTKRRILLEVDDVQIVQEVPPEPSTGMQPCTAVTIRSLSSKEPARILLAEPFDQFATRFALLASPQRASLFLACRIVDDLKDRRGFKSVLSTMAEGDVNALTDDLARLIALR